MAVRLTRNSKESVRFGPSALHYPHRPREPLQLPLFHGLEQRGVAVLGAHGFRDQDLIGGRFAAQARGELHGGAEQVVAVRDRLAAVEANADVDRLLAVLVVVAERALDADRAVDAAAAV